MQILSQFVSLKRLLCISTFNKLFLLKIFLILLQEIEFWEYLLAAYLKINLRPYNLTVIKHDQLSLSS